MSASIGVRRLSLFTWSAACRCAVGCGLGCALMCNGGLAQEPTDTGSGSVAVTGADSQQKQSAATQPSADAPSEDADAAIPRELFRGRVVMLPDALERKGIPSTAEFEDQVVLETPEGTLIPIVPDWRGRAFYQDERLRNRDVELVGYRRPGVPYLQVLMIFTFDEQGERQYTDYWCDICSIPMYQIKPCDCCQGDIRLRFQPQGLPDYVQQPGDADDTSDTSEDAAKQ